MSLGKKVRPYRITKNFSDHFKILISNRHSAMYLDELRLEWRAKKSR